MAAHSKALGDLCEVRQRQRPAEDCGHLEQQWMRYGVGMRRRARRREVDEPGSTTQLPRTAKGVDCAMRARARAQAQRGPVRKYEAERFPRLPQTLPFGSRPPTRMHSREKARRSHPVQGREERARKDCPQYACSPGQMRSYRSSSRSSCNRLIRQPTKRRAAVRQ